MPAKSDDSLAILNFFFPKSVQVAVRPHERGPVFDAKFGDRSVSRLQDDAFRSVALRRFDPLDIVFILHRMLDGADRNLDALPVSLRARRVFFGGVGIVDFRFFQRHRLPATNEFAGTVVQNFDHFSANFAKINFRFFHR